MFFLNKIREKDGGTGSAWKQCGEEVAHTIYTYE
jgi:hypothetical protein